MEEPMKEGIFRIVRFVASPLRFFAVTVIGAFGLALGLAWKSNMPAEVTARLIYLVLGSSGLLIVAVTYLIIFHPRKLVFDQEAHLTVLRERLGDSEFKLAYLPGTLVQEQPQKKIAETVSK